MNSDKQSDLKIIVNPFYSVNISNHLFNGSGPQVSSEDWILLNAQLLEDIGAKDWLEEFLELMSLSGARYNGHDIINPTLAISLSRRFKGEHEALVTRKEWVNANLKLIDEIGPGKWLQSLLGVLESNIN